jgi:hypothetical protein
MARRQDNNEPQWQVVSIRKRGHLLGIVRAKDAVRTGMTV